MKVKMIYSLSFSGLERKLNDFLEQNQNKIEVIDIKWKTFIDHYVMIVYKTKETI
ncbi:hypothetical protein EDC18_101269 [Natranaerovirga pectinivora]|uniref:Uncharacterized protein n=1 Tax=Natranaerovirga pectinivora TaxID=682400 RepID=A0A4R3MR26_9FIRM|nr:hypothetical protein [Natranaerovirga pectinivora]TCT16973.1 hypothetical protein EDC18_101269 [Natranaerovirga pectinivora]